MKQVKHQLLVASLDAVIMAMVQFSFVIIAMHTDHPIMAVIFGLCSVISIANAVIRYNLSKGMNE